VWALKTMDYFGILPKFLEKLSPFHGSMFITSMGSLGIPPIYHHLYDFGTVPVFCSFGAKQKAYELQPDGTVKERRFITLMWTLDERICDGFYYATAMKTLRNILRNPYVLDERPEQVFEDVE
ncbi:MAG: 2-oxo acid dehydrogenase subunit E2, partial [Clostridia bacterium]|nr:2-oxo acid dehydrogenase subunit E2 [Clostridia bacterium]